MILIVSYRGDGLKDEDTKMGGSKGATHVYFCSSEFQTSRELDETRVVGVRR
jgi:hypothetical protein